MREEEFVIRPSLSIIVGQHKLWITRSIGLMASQCSRRLARCTLVHSFANITVARACALLAIGITNYQATLAMWGVLHGFAGCQATLATGGIRHSAFGPFLIMVVDHGV